MPRGGYRQPNNPAPVSGPGALSRRTDGNPTQSAQYMAGGAYGEGKQMLEMQRSAPMAAASRPNIKAAPIQDLNLAPIVPLNAPTQRPDEPLTAGMPFGAGPNRVGPVVQQASLSETLAKVLDNDVTGELTELYDYLITRGL